MEERKRERCSKRKSRNFKIISTGGIKKVKRHNGKIKILTKGIKKQFNNGVKKLIAKPFWIKIGILTTKEIQEVKNKLLILFLVWFIIFWEKRREKLMTKLNIKPTW